MTARCRHGFLLEQVACPAGCGGTDTKQCNVGRGRRLAVEKQTQRTTPITDAQIERALTGASSVRSARDKLGSINDQTMKARCRAVPNLWALYLAAKAAGEKISRRRYGWRKE